MAQIDYSTVPATVTITNNTPAVAIDDPGAEVRGLTEKFSDVKIQLFQLNDFVTVPAGDSVVLKIETSEEAAYYASLATDAVAVEIAAVE